MILVAVHRILFVFIAKFCVFGMGTYPLNVSMKSC
jgi:hypothetical protein